MGLPEEPKHSEIRRGGAQDLEESKRRNDSVHAVARRVASLRLARRNYRKLPNEALPGQPRHGPGPIPPSVSSQRNRSGTDLHADPEAAIPNQDTRARQSSQPHGRSQELLALHKRPV